MALFNTLGGEHIDGLINLMNVCYVKNQAYVIFVRPKLIAISGRFRNSVYEPMLEILFFREKTQAFVINHKSFTYS